MKRPVTVKSYHGIGWNIRPGNWYARKKPDAIHIAEGVAESRGIDRVLIYKDDGTLQRTIRINTRPHGGRREGITKCRTQNRSHVIKDTC